jgi:hypothetical protein
MHVRAYLSRVNGEVDPRLAVDLALQEGVARALDVGEPLRVLLAHLHREVAQRPVLVVLVVANPCVRACVYECVCFPMRCNYYVGST